VRSGWTLGELGDEDGFPVGADGAAQLQRQACESSVNQEPRNPRIDFVLAIQKPRSQERFAFMVSRLWD